MKETKMDKLTTEFAEHICDNLCHYPHLLNEEELEDKCLVCEMDKFICDILNEHNRILEQVQQLKERDTAKNPITYSGTNRADCPICGATVRGIGKPFGEFCGKCGQRLDWSE